MFHGWWTTELPHGVIHIVAISRSQGGSTLPYVPTCKHCALCHSGGWSDRGLSEVLCAVSYRPDGHKDWFWRWTEVLCPAALDLPVDQRQYATHSTRRYTYNFQLNDLGLIYTSVWAACRALHHCEHLQHRLVNVACWYGHKEIWTKIHFRYYMMVDLRVRLVFYNLFISHPCMGITLTSCLDQQCLSIAAPT